MSIPRRQRQRTVQEVIRDLRGMLGHVGRRDKDTLLEAIEGLVDLAQRLHVAQRMIQDLKDIAVGGESGESHSPVPRETPLDAAACEEKDAITAL